MFLLPNKQPNVSINDKIDIDRMIICCFAVSIVPKPDWSENTFDADLRHA